MGVALAARLAAGLASAGLSQVSVSVLLDADTGAATAATLSSARDALASAAQGVFVVALISALLAWIVTAFAPRERLGVMLSSSARHSRRF